MNLFTKTIGKKLDFMVIGAQKGGTTALDAYLRNHPEVGMAHGKEVHFFDNEDNFKTKKVDFSSYESKENFSKNKLIYGEATPIYLYWTPSCRRIWEYNKNIKLIAVLRNPAERAFSHWNMEVSKKNETNDFMYCIQHESERSKETLPLQHRIYSYIDRGFYSEQIRRYQRFFWKEQLFFIKYEDFRKNQEQHLIDLFSFLNVKTDGIKFQAKDVHSRSYQKQMTDEERKYLSGIYKNDIHEVERLLGWDCSDWL